MYIAELVSTNQPKEWVKRDTEEDAAHALACILKAAQLIPDIQEATNFAQSLPLGMPTRIPGTNDLVMIKRLT